MNCQRFEEVVTDLTRGQIMQAGTREEALSHADHCSECQARLSNEEALTRGLQDLSHQMNAATPPIELEFNLRKEFRLRQNPPAVVQASHSYGKYWLVAVAAVLLIVFSLIGISFRSQKHSSGEMAKTSESSKATTNIQNTDQPKQTVALNTNSSEQVKPRHTYRAPRIRSRRIEPRQSVYTNMIAMNNTAKEITTEFMPLGYMGSASLQDGGQIVRVEMPRSALANFGLPVNMDRYNEKVKADVVLGVDGLAHAIRFVQ